MLLAFLAFSLLVTPRALAAPQRSEVDYQADVAFALVELEKECGHFFPQKGVDWKAVSKEFLKHARETKSVEEHWVLLTRLVARLRDGHAQVQKLPAAGEIEWIGPSYADQVGPGMFWCKSGKNLYVKSAWAGAAASGVLAGMQVVKVEGEPALKWLEKRIAERRDLTGFSTEQQAFYHGCHFGLGGPPGSRIALELLGTDGKRKKLTLTRERASVVPSGPVVPPEGLERIGRQSYGRTARGLGYIHLRDVPAELPAQLDTMLAALAGVPGLILDCRANGGGGCDHDAVLGRFVPKGKRLVREGAGPIESAGEAPYGGPLVVIVDAGVRSAGETVAGMFQEDGRGFLIGESATAGMSSSKKTIELPSKLFALYVSVHSNKARFQGGRGIEGVGIEPREIVEYDPEELARGVDTLLRRAEELLAKGLPVKPRFESGS